MPELTPLDDLLLRNPNAPTNDEYALHLARQFYRPRDARDGDRLVVGLVEGAQEIAAADGTEVEWCGESTRGLLDAALASTLLSPDARAEITKMMIDAAPGLDRSKTIGHFRFRWTETSTDARDNTNEANVDATAAELNAAWDRFVADFRRPKADLIGGTRIIDVDCYYDGGLHGSTSSHRNQIFLNSHTVVNDACRRRTTSAHELFHRVEYAYGYITGTAGQRWWVEAMASWSQEYYAPDVDDYISRVNGGLNNPALPLLGRSYDACHYWKYLGEQLTQRSTAIASEEDAIREILDRYAVNGLDMRAASGHVTTARLSRTFDRAFADWSKANFLKDLTGPGARYDYLEDETSSTSCGRNYGPYRHVAPDTDEEITGNAFAWSSGIRDVASYGTRYHHFELDPAVSRLDVQFSGNVGGGSNSYSVHLALISADRWKVIYNSYATTERRWTLSFDPGRYDRCVLIVNGLATTAPYEVNVNSCISGTWRDGYGYVWTLAQTGTNLAGTVATTTCGTYGVTGTVTASGDIALDANGPCCDFTYTGSIVDCQNGSGNWTNDCGGSGSWTMAKIDPGDAAAILEDEPEEHADAPATMRS